MPRRLHVLARVRGREVSNIVYVFDTYLLPLRRITVPVWEVPTYCCCRGAGHAGDVQAGPLFGHPRP